MNKEKRILVNDKRDWVDPRLRGCPAGGYLPWHPTPEPAGLPDAYEDQLKEKPYGRQLP